MFFLNIILAALWTAWGFKTISNNLFILESLAQTHTHIHTDLHQCGFDVSEFLLTLFNSFENSTYESQENI